MSHETFDLFQYLLQQAGSVPGSFMDTTEDNEMRKRLEALNPKIATEPRRRRRRRYSSGRFRNFSRQQRRRTERRIVDRKTFKRSG